MPELPLEDVQGFVLRPYGRPALRVFLLRVESAPSAGRFLRSLVGGDASVPQLTSAAPWVTKPNFCINVGFTYAGLAALKLHPQTLASFPAEFVAGAVNRAARVGDVDESAPEHWKGGLADASRIHTLLFVFAQSDAILDNVSADLRTLFGKCPAFSEVSVQDGRALPGSVAHFGYRDGLSQPTVEGGPRPSVAEVLPTAPAGEFLLGYPSQYDSFTYPVPQPRELGHNGTFLAFRILAQNCAAFEKFLVSAATQTGLDPELIAAKLCGRWRSGVPLALSPQSADSFLPLEQYNAFDYAPTSELPNANDDRRGYRCPIGSHVRRMNPRHSLVAGNSGLKRRIMRRGLTYGPPYDPMNPDDGIERGLLGLFIGVSLKDQFEFLMSDWANKATFAPGLRDTRDPINGDNSGPGATFLIPVEGQPPLELVGLSRFVTCRGAAYCFLPGITALKYVAGVAGKG